MAARHRWQVALADLSLLIACAMAVAAEGAVRDEQAARAAAVRAAAWHVPAERLFVAGEAMLRADATPILDTVAPRWSGSPVEVRIGLAAADAGWRLDRHDLAAARAAALSRALAQRGVVADQLAVRPGRGIEVGPAAPLPPRRVGG